MQSFLKKKTLKFPFSTFYPFIVIISKKRWMWKCMGKCGEVYVQKGEPVCAEVPISVRVSHRKC